MRDNFLIEDSIAHIVAGTEKLPSGLVVLDPKGPTVYGMPTENVDPKLLQIVADPGFQYAPSQIKSRAFIKSSLVHLGSHMGLEFAFNEPTEEVYDYTSNGLGRLPVVSDADKFMAEMQFIQGALQTTTLEMPIEALMDYYEHAWTEDILPHADLSQLERLQVGNVLVCNFDFENIFTGGAMLITEYRPLSRGHINAPGIIEGHATAPGRFYEVSGMECPGWNRIQLVKELLMNSWKCSSLEGFAADMGQDPRFKGQKLIENPQALVNPAYH